MTISSERAEQIFSELANYVLELSHEPQMLGHTYFQDMIATCRNYLNKVSLLESEINFLRMNVSGELRRKQAVHDMDYDELLTNDPGIRTLGNIDDRKAAVGYKLKAQRKEISDLKDRQQVLDFVYKAIVTRSRELNHTMQAIKEQRQFLSSGVRAGEFYGDERSGAGKPDASPTLPTFEEVSAEELASLLSDSPPAPTEPTESIETVEEPTTPPVKAASDDEDEAQIAQFLSAPIDASSDMLAAYSDTEISALLHDV